MKFGGFFIALALILAACTSDPKPREPEPTSTSTPAASATATPPIRPAQASEDSPEGAAAFVTYWVALVNYSAKSGDTEPLLKASQACLSCESFIAALARPGSGIRPERSIWQVTRIEPFAGGARAKVKVFESGKWERYDLRFDLTAKQPYAVENIERGNS